MRLTRLAAVSAAALLSGSTLSVVATSVNPASAACAPSTVAATHATAKKKVKVSTRTSVRKVGRRFVATVRITATQGAATVTVAQTICPDGAAGSAASTTQAASGVGTLTKTASARGSSKSAAKRAARAKASLAVARIRKAGMTKKGLAAAKRRATAAAQAAASGKAHHALYDSSLYWLNIGPDGKIVVSPSQPAGALSLVAAANGDVVLSASVAVDPSKIETALPCVRRAPAWPSSFLASATAVLSPALRAAADTSDKKLQVGFAPVNYKSGDSGAPEHVGSLWMYDFDGSSGSGVTERSGFQPTSGEVGPFAGDGLCFTFGQQTPAGTSVTFRGLAVGSSFTQSPTSAGVTGGVPVVIR